MNAEKVHIKEIIGGRYDNSFVLYHHRMSNYKYPCSPLNRFLIGKPQYGAGEAGVPREDNESPRYIRITDIDWNGSLDESLGVTAKTIEEKYILNNNDILIARSGNTVGKSYIHKTEIVKEPCFFAGYLIRFVVDSNLISPDYIFIFTKLPVYNDWVKVTQRVTGQPNINAEEYGNLPVPVPPIDVQQRIVEIYSKAQQTRLDKFKEAKELLDGIDDYLLEMLGIDKKRNTNYKKQPIFRGISLLLGGRLDPQQFHPERMEVVDKIKKGNWCRLKDVRNDVKTISNKIPSGEIYIGLENIDSSTGDYVESKEKEIVSSAARFRKGDILFPKLRPYLNKVHRAQFDGFCSTEFHVFEAHDIDPDYLTIVLRSSLTLAQTKHLMTGNTLPRLQTTDVEELVIPNPDVPLQVEIVKYIYGIKDKAKQLQKEGDAILEKAKQEIEKMIIG